MKIQISEIVKRSVYTMLFLFILATSACSVESTTGPNTWIDSPGNGAILQTGDTIQIRSHVFARGGVAEVVLSVNGEPYRRDIPKAASSEFVAMDQDWIPDNSGVYTIQVQGYDAQGVPAQPATVRVNVLGKTQLVAVAPIISQTPEISPTPVITLTPTLFISVTPEYTRTPTIPPGSIVSFYAKPNQIKAGECTTIYWAVQNAQRVIFGGIDQPFVGSYQDCLCSTQRFSLRVIDLDGTDKTHTVEIGVSGSCTTDVPPEEPVQEPIEEPEPVVDQTPPSVPVPGVPKSGSTLSCRSSQTLAWAPSKDNSGGSIVYYVKLEIMVKKGIWQSASGYGPINGKQVNANVQCGGIYRWMVRAKDEAGNYSAWSSPSTFSINID